MATTTTTTTTLTTTTATTTISSTLPYLPTPGRTPATPFTYYLPPFVMPAPSAPSGMASAEHKPPVQPQPIFTNGSNIMVALNAIESYEGGPDLEGFFDSVAAVAECHEWNDHQVAHVMKLKLRGEARHCYYALPADKRPTTTLAMRNWLMQLFGPKFDRAAAEREFSKMFRKKDESLRKFVFRLEAAAVKLYPVSGPDEIALLRSRVKREAALVRQFFDGIETRLANEVKRFRDFDTLEEALPYAEHCEEVLSRLVKETRADAHQAVRVLNKRQERTPRPPRGRPRAEPKESSEKASGGRITGRCYYCKEVGHFARDCPKKAKKQEKKRENSHEAPLNSQSVPAATQRRTE